MNPAAAAVHPPTLGLRLEHGVPVLVLDESADIEGLRAAIRTHLPEYLTAIGGRSTRLDLGAREIALFDLRRVIHLMRQEYSVEITGLYVRTGAIHRFAERELKLKLFPNDTDETSGEISGEDEPDTEEFHDDSAPVEPAVVADLVEEPEALDGLDRLKRVTLPHDIDPADLVDADAALGHAAEQLLELTPNRTPQPTPSPAPGRTDAPVARQQPRATSAPATAPPEPAHTGSEQHTGPPLLPGEEARTCTLHRTLRSGAVVRFDGDLYVFGDVNPGAQVIATGNIIVLGALKGVAHAGAAGDESSFILAFDLRPTQLRIGRKIAVPPPRRSSAPPPSEIASVSDGHIVIETYRGRTRS